MVRTRRANYGNDSESWNGKSAKRKKIAKQASPSSNSYFVIVKPGGADALPDGSQSQLTTPDDDHQFSTESDGNTVATDNFDPYAAVPEEISDLLIELETLESRESQICFREQAHHIVGRLQWELLVSDDIDTKAQKFPTLKAFCDLGGVMRLLAKLNTHLNDPKSVNRIARILWHCLSPLDRTIETFAKVKKEDGIEDINYNLIFTSDVLPRRTEDLQRISNETAAIIVRRKGIKTLLRISDLYIEALMKATFGTHDMDEDEQTHYREDSTISTKDHLDADDSTVSSKDETLEVSIPEEGVESIMALAHIWRVIYLVIHDSTAANAIPRDTIVELCRSAKFALVVLGKFVDFRGVEKGLTVELMTTYAMAQLFGTLDGLVEFSSVATDKKFYEIQRVIIRQCMCILETNYYRDECISGGYRVYVTASNFLINFFAKLEQNMNTSKE